MRILIILLLSFIAPVAFLSAQVIKVQPYLQNVTPESIVVMWETDEGEESIVEWGLTDELGNLSTGTSFTSWGTAKIHEVHLQGLSSFTHYHYRVKTGTALSAINHFKTPPFASENESFRIVAMSDMQRDNSQPGKFHEIINEGVIDYITESTGGEIVDNLALVMIPGDLVPNGLSYSQWEEYFFTPAEELFKEVPVYPVLGNHEINSAFYFDYFNLPENGPPGYEEHTWYKDYGNVRIIGLDSNSPYDSQEQLDWLEVLLISTCSIDSIDFVFAQLHHPHKSELWLPGESDYTGEVIELLENFTTNCGKPSIHFFGHTHGYSRGQSRDHKHLWINVATAGGYIDHWGEWPQFDYDEFSVSQDEYGFVTLEVVSDNDPHFVVKRISRGDPTNVLDNVVKDSLVVRLTPTVVETPTAVFPVGELVPPGCVKLKASSFVSQSPNALHGQSHWQLQTDPGNFDNPLVENWKNYENIYYNTDTQENDDLTDERIYDLEENTNYYWRVRYRDRELNWSEWSVPAQFTTGDYQLSPNLLINPGAEDDLIGWTIVEGVMEALTDGECDGISPHTGIKYFAVGGVCENGAYGRGIQNVDVLNYADSIDGGEFYAKFGGFLSNYNGNDLPEMRILFLDENENALGTSEKHSNLNDYWTLYSSWEIIPVQTRIIQFELTGTRNSGFDNDSYFDDLFLRVGSKLGSCNEFGLDLKVFIEGPYDETTGLMSTHLNAETIPLSQPYNIPPWNYNGNESINETIPENIVDWILVELRDAPDAISATSETIIERQAALLTSDGSIVNAHDLSSQISFINLPVNDLFVVIYHRNHIGIMSAYPLTTPTDVYPYDFSSSAERVHGGDEGHKTIEYGVWGMIAGDYNANGTIDYNDYINGWMIQSGSSGYNSADFNLNQEVNNPDKNDFWLINIGSGTTIPE